MVEQKWRSAISIVILTLLALTPIFNIVTVFNIIICSPGRFLSSGCDGFVPTPLGIKLIKDIGFLVIAVLSFMAIAAAGKIKRFLIISGPMLLVIAILFALSYKSNKIQAVAGLRWAFPFLLPVFLIGNIDDAFMPKLSKMAAIICLINISFQICEQLITNGIIAIQRPYPFTSVDAVLLGQNIFGMRPPGIFNAPNTGAYFICVAAFLSYFYLKITILRRAVLILTPVGILLSGSATAVIIYAISVAIIMIEKSHRGTIAASFISLILIGFIILKLPYLSGREHVFQSALNRVQILRECLNAPELISTHFGYRTDAFNAFAKKFRISDIDLAPQSIPTALVANIGLLGSIVIAGAYIYWIIAIIRSRRMDAIIFTLVYTLFSLILSTSEAFPMNLILAVGIVYFAPKVLARSC